MTLDERWLICYNEVKDLLDLCEQNRHKNQYE